MRSPNFRLDLRLGDYRRVLFAALNAHPGRVVMVTVTPPGGEWSPWEAREWNRTAAQRWARFDRWAKARLRRQGLSVVVLSRVAQRQRRGLDHLHLVLRLEDGDVPAVIEYVRLLKSKHGHYGFGFVDNPWHGGRARVFENAGRAAAYLAPYLVESSQLAAMVSAGDHSFRPLWVRPELLQRSTVTMRRLRRVRHAWFVREALAQGSRPTLPVWWEDIGERTRVVRLLRQEDRAPPVERAPLAA